MFFSRLSAPQTIALGATAGVVTANLMTVLRMIARRAGLIDKTVPQAMEEWMLEKLGRDFPGEPVTHHVVDQVLHMGYAMGFGALEGYLRYRKVSNAYARGLLMGAGTWAFAGIILLPALKVSKSAFDSEPKENLVNLSAHLIFGLATSLVTEEFIEQGKRRRTTEGERKLAKVG